MLALGWRKPLLCENSILCLEGLKIILISGSAPPWLGNRPGPTRSEGRVPRASWSPSLGLGFEILFLGWLPDSKAGSGNRGPARDSRAPVSAPKTLSAGFCLPFRVFWFVLLNIQIPGARNSWAPGSRSEAGSWGLVQTQGHPMAAALDASARFRVMRCARGVSDHYHYLSGRPPRLGDRLS